MLALEGIKVLDLTRASPGAMCTMVLGDLGAEVIKIETPDHISGRGVGFLRSPAGEDKDNRAAFNALDRNKKSLALNLKSEEGRGVFLHLAEKADVIVEGFRPGAVNRLGIDYQSISELNSRIIYCSLSGYGQSGPYAQFSGHDINYIAMAGVLSLIGEWDGPPVVPLNLIADAAGAPLYGVIGILAAIAARHRTGVGQYLDIAFTDAAISLLTYYTTEYFRSGTVLKRGESTFQGAYPYYAIYETKDHKYITLGCIENWFWEDFCRAIDREDLAPYQFSGKHIWGKTDDQKWETVRASLEEAFLTRTRDEWFDFLIEKGIPVGKVYSLDEVFSDPQVEQRQMLIEIDHPKAGKIKQVGIPIKMSDAPGAVRSFAPLLGEHTEEILLDSGYSREQIDKFRRDKVIG